MNIKIEKMNLKKPIMILLLFMSISCFKDNDDQQDDNCIEEQTEFVSEVNGPTAANVGETISIEVKFGVHNGCGQFQEFVETGTEINRFIEVKAKYEGCWCTQDAPTRTVTYDFTPSATGTYELNFVTAGGEYIVHQVEVQ